MKTHPHLPTLSCLPMPQRAPHNQISASPSTGLCTQPHRMTTIPCQPTLPQGTSMIPHLSPPPYQDSPSPIMGPLRLLEQLRYGSEQPPPPPLCPNLQQPFILHFTVPHTTVIQPEHSSTPRYTTWMVRGGGSIPPPPVRHFTQTCMHPLPHLLEEEVSCLP